MTQRLVVSNASPPAGADDNCGNVYEAPIRGNYLSDSDGAKLETRYMVLAPYSNWQFNGIFQNYAPVNGYVEVRTNTPDAAFTCYGSVLDNLTSDPTTVLPQ